ncbi:helix-turn-helix domain-containing protein [Caenimonas sedimenti]|uniref:Helix-turn-helix domain-containing protein n=1 Tax=Caenimonas sedimenti TaxID=2596921 RepID=A0A562ZQE9_9BURK|nr:helix-turn-helix domain-containing protein [Caenimonas sedimenti]TWO70576.1 helix-turn-helix domain-containing protein [Caenimonas sedimenti]
MHDFTVLVLPGAFASSVAATLDMVAAAAALAPRASAAPPRWRVKSPEGGRVTLGNGMTVDTDALARRARPDRSAWIVPGLGTENPGAIRARLAEPGAQRAVAALRAQHAAGGSLAASCSAVFLLQAAGALAGRRVTTSWWLASRLQQIEPACVVAAERMVCVDGPVATAGAAFAQTDLMLHLLQSRFGTPLAELVRRVLVLDARQAQAGYAVPAMLATGNALVARVTARIEAGLPRPPSVADLAGEFAMSERTLARHVRAATGLGPLALVQNVRLQRARALIETSKMSIAQVAEQVGYEDATALRRMMRKWAGANPSAFRTHVASA